MSSFIIVEKYERLLRVLLSPRAYTRLPHESSCSHEESYVQRSQQIGKGGPFDTDLILV